MLAVAALSQAPGPSAPYSSPYNSPNGKFSVDFPKAPKLETDHFKVKGVDVTENTYSLLDDEHKGVWTVIERVSPVKIDEQAAVNEHWDEFQNGTKLLGGPYDDSKRFGHPAIGGVALVPLDQDSSIMTMVLITANVDRVYMVAYACDYAHAKDVPSEMPGGFIKSFKMK